MSTVTYTVFDGEIISEERDGVERDYLPDPLGSTLALLDDSQTQTDTFTFWPYGEEKSRTGTTPTPFTYIGTRGYYVDNVKSTYLRARHYSPSQGRFVSLDPIGFAGGTNLYGYTGGNPVNWIDPLGLNRKGSPEWCDQVKAKLDKALSELRDLLNKYNPYDDWEGGHRYDHPWGSGVTKPAGHWIRIQELQRAVARYWMDWYQNCGPRVPMQPPKECTERIPYPYPRPWKFQARPVFSSRPIFQGGAGQQVGTGLAWGTILLIIIWQGSRIIPIRNVVPA